MFTTLTCYGQVQLNFSTNPICANYLISGASLTNVEIFGGLVLPDGQPVTGNGNGLTNIPPKNIAATITNYAGTALSFSVPYQSIITNAAFTLIPPIGFVATAYNATACDVTNTTGAVVVITPCPGWLTEGTWNVTNISEISLFARAGWTNAICLPIK